MVVAQLARLDPFLSRNPSKRITELYWLAYTPVWGGVSAVVMLGGFAERWGDWECMVYGLVLALGAVLGPTLLRPREEQRRAIVRTTGFKMSLSVAGLAFGLNYTQTPFFWDVLHMHYGFNTQINIANNPVFLYFVSVAYFSTYAALCCISFRMLRRALVGRSRLLMGSAYVVAPMLMAFLETALNANPSIARLFCYDDLTFMMWFGSLAYGAAFVFVLPLWMAIDETHEDPTSPQTSPFFILIGLCAVLYADLITLDLLRYHVAPHFTVVEQDAVGLRDFDGSCLETNPHLPPSAIRHEDPPLATATKRSSL